MSERDDLLRYVISRPEEDAPRLVLADWLDEHSQSARAEFVRVQVELAAGVADPQRRRLLEGRESTLWYTHGDAWRKELPAWARKGAEFRRGFGFAVAAGPNGFLKGADLLARRAPVCGLRLSVWQDGHVSALAQSPALARLTVLTIDGMSPERAPLLAASPHTAGLFALGVRGNVPMDWVPALLASPRLAGLTAFGVSGEGGTWGAAGSLARFLRLPAVARLTSLTLSASGLAGYHGDDLADAPSLATKTELVLSDNAHFGDEGVARLAGSPGLANLTRLDLSACGVTDESVRALAVSPYLSRLTDLELARNWAVTPAGLRSLAEGLPSLVRVSVWGTVAPGMMASSPELERRADGRVYFWPRRLEAAP